MKKKGHKEAFADPYVSVGAYYPYCGTSVTPRLGKWLRSGKVLVGSTAAMCIWDLPMHVAVGAVEGVVEEGYKCHSLQGALTLSVNEVASGAVGRV